MRYSNEKGEKPELCSCVQLLQHQCNFSTDALSTRSEDYESEFGRMIYTISILLMFSFVIVLLMIRSIKRSSSTVEMESLLDAMRFREELDIRDRQRRRLLKAKTKVTAWLTRTQGLEQKYGPRKQTSVSTNSEIPEIVVTEDMTHMSRSRTPALSLIYDFVGGDSSDVRTFDERRSTITSSKDDSLSRTFSMELDATTPRVVFKSDSISFDT